MKIQIDNREPPRFVAWLTKKLEEEKHEVEVLQLPVGDIVIPEKGICIERKTVQDFYGSKTDGRLDTQIEQMKQYPTHCIIIVGPSNSFIFTVMKYLNEKSFFGMYRSVVLKKNCPVFKVDNNHQLWCVLNSIIIHSGDSLDKPIESRSIHSTHQDVKIGIIAAIPGIGHKKAEKVFKKYDTILQVVLALKDGTFKIHGFGPSTLSSMNRAFLNK